MTVSERLALQQRVMTLLFQIEVAVQSDAPVIDSRWVSDYQQQATLLCKQATLESIPLLLRMTQLGTLLRQHSRTQHPFLGCADRGALEAARTLVRLAEAEPSRELQPALVTLQQQALSPYAPLEFIPIRIRLARALKRCSGLPIPATAPSSFAEAQNLPLLTQDKPS